GKAPQRPSGGAVARGVHRAHGEPQPGAAEENPGGGPRQPRARVPMNKTIQRLRVRAGGALIEGGSAPPARRGALHPRGHPGRHGVEVLRDIPYRAGGAEAHTLDVYRPVRRDGRRPVVLYVHGGAFRILSKDTHWMMGLAFARRGYVVFN